MGKSLDELYSAEPGDTGVSQAVEVEAKPEAKAEAPKAEGSEPTPAAVKDGVPPAPQESPDDKIPRAALTDERKKRQSLEASNKELQRRLDDLEKRIPAVETERPTDPLIDPEGFVREMEVARWEDKLELTSEFVRSQVGDEAYNAAEQAVLHAANTNPNFAEKFSMEVARAKNPGRYTYEVGKTILAQMEANDPVKVRTKFRDEIKAELMAELGMSPAQSERAGQPVAKPSIPTSLAGYQSNGPRNPGARPIKRRSLDELYKT